VIAADLFARDSLFLSSKAALADSPNSAATHWIEMSNHEVSIAAVNPLVRATWSGRLKIARAIAKAVFDDCRGWVDAKVQVLVSTERSDKGFAQCIGASKTGWKKLFGAAQH
jgi:hypothetical protein